MNTTSRLSTVLALSCTLATASARAGDGPPTGQVEGPVTVVAPAGPRPAGGLTSRIRSLTGGGSDAWDKAVGGELVTAFDRDHSGVLDSAEEVDAVPCEVWAAIDEGVLAGWGRGVWVIYGFAADRAWVGEALRVAEAMRGHTSERLAACGLATDAPAIPPTPAAMPRRIEALPAGGSDLWDVAARGLILSVYDADKSGVVDTPAEVGLIGCETWKALDAGVRRGWPTGLYLTYGFSPPMLYLGDVLGLAVDVREQAAESLRRCGLEEKPVDGHLTPVGSDVFRVVIEQVPSSSPGWEGFVREMLTRLYDVDHDGVIDEPAEARSVGCDVWSSLDQVLRRDRQQGLYDTYGFDPDGRWTGDLLGVAGPLRAIVADQLLSCGVGPQAGATDFVAGSGTATLAPELSAHDLDHSGRIDSAAELQAVPCSAWKQLDARSRQAAGLGIVDRYGLEKGTLWTGDAIGLSPSLRQAARHAVETCVGAGGK